MKKGVGVRGAVVSAAAVLCCAAFYGGIAVRRYKIQTGKLPFGMKLRFLIAADLHSNRFGEKQEILLEVMRKEEPDFILMPGDIIDDKRPIRGAREFLEGAAKIAPSYYCPGNHEYRTGDMGKVISVVKKSGVKALMNGYERVQTSAGEIIIAGSEDPERSKLEGEGNYGHGRAMCRAFGKIKEENMFSILLAHRPDLYPLYEMFDFDVIVSGHAHGGQVRVPFLLPEGLYAPEQGFFPESTGGCRYRNGGAQVISRGLAVHRFVPRVFNPPEIVIAEVIGGLSVKWQR